MTAASSGPKGTPGPVVFDRPLLLTPREDLAGYALSGAGRAVLFGIAASSVVSVFLIFFFILREAVPFFFQGESAAATLARAAGRLGELFTSTRWYPEHEARPEFGILAILLGSLYVSAVGLAFAVPLGVLTAICLSDIFPFWLRQVVKPVVEVLAAIPSVAYGFFAVLVVAPMAQRWLGLPTGTNALNAGLVLGVMAMPTIVSVSEDSLSALGRDLREASYSLGATRAETVVRVLIPAAHNGIIAAVILGMMRAVGETMVVWMASGNAPQVPSPWWDLGQSVRTLTATIAGEMGETAKGSTHYHALFALGLVLLVFTFSLNLVAEWLLARVRRMGGPQP
jgi:phosphate ABC transporter permease protein PstC